MATGYWQSPVGVHAGRAGATLYRVTDAAKAAEILLYAWPRRRGPKHAAARRVMLACLEGRCAPAEARAAFVAAAEEAGILAR